MRSREDAALFSGTLKASNLQQLPQLRSSSKLKLDVLQLMDKLMPLVSENRRSFENNVRVCLSTNKCFVKVRSKIPAWLPSWPWV